MNAELIFWPMIALAFATMLVYWFMSKARVKTVKEGTVSSSVYRHNVGEPEESLRFNRAIVNQFESPVLFYTVCICAYITQNASTIMVALAWLYGVSKIAHIIVHTSTNKLSHRRPLFMFTMVILILLWLVFAAGLTGLI